MKLKRWYVVLRDAMNRIFSQSLYDHHLAGTHILSQVHIIPHTRGRCCAYAHVAAVHREPKLPAEQPIKREQRTPPSAIYGADIVNVCSSDNRVVVRQIIVGAGHVQVSDVRYYSASSPEPIRSRCAYAGAPHC
jgi:hypothetical protein